MRIALPDSAAQLPPSLIPGFYAPEIGQAAAAFSRVTYMRSALSLREFEAARMITAHVNGCQLCQNWRSAADLPLYLKSGGHAGAGSVADNGEVPNEAFYQAVADWRNAGAFTPRERAALEFAERMGTEPKLLAADEIFWKRAKSLFSDAELVDLAFCVAAWIGLGRMTHVLGVDAVCGLPTRNAA